MSYTSSNELKLTKDIFENTQGTTSLQCKQIEF
uniref:Uncharacterized protein n=1 Tax=Rhizophora mucronata TaxID=61149 RepID=A0A2P2ILH4_RHIMU